MDLTIRLTRGTSGEVLAAGAFDLLRVELVGDGETLSLTCREADSARPRILNVQVRAAALEEVPRRDVELELVTFSPKAAEDHVLARYRL